MNRNAMTILAVSVIVAFGIGYAIDDKSAEKTTQTVLVVDTVRKLPANLRSIQNLQIHYVGTGAEGIIQVDLKNLVQPAIVMLGSKKKVDWRLIGAARHLKAVILSPVIRASQVRGLPAGTPVLGFQMGRAVLTRLKPHCPTRRGTELRCPDWSPRHGARFQEIEAMTEAFSGVPITSVTFAGPASASVVPGTPVDQETRAEIKAKSDELLEIYEAAKQIKENRQGFRNRYTADLQRELADLLAQHPQPKAGAQATQARKIHVISIRGGVSTRFGNPRSATTYEAYRKYRDQGRPGVVVRLQDPSRAVLILVSSKAVRWKIETPKMGNILGVYISSRDISFIDGLPRTVPLSVKAQENGDFKRLTWRAGAKGEQALLNQVKERFPGATIVLHSFGHKNVVLIR